MAQLFDRFSPVTAQKGLPKSLFQSHQHQTAYKQPILPNSTLSQRRSFRSEAASANYILILEHNRINECVALTQTDNGIRAGEIFELKNYIVLC